MYRRDVGVASLEERQKVQMEIGVICFAFLAVIALIIQLIGGFMVFWTVVGSVAVVLAIIFMMMKRN
jgi:hypothetical protein